MSIQVQEKVSLKDKTTLGVGGPAAQYVEVNSISGLAEAVLYAQKAALPLFVLGGGSNVLVSDNGFAGLIVKMQIVGRSYVETDIYSVLATFGAGEILDEVVSETVERGWWGLENLSSIPGTVGATPIQNVGAYGVEVAELIENIEVYDTLTNSLITMTASQCNFGYRDSIFKQEAGKRYIITNVTFRLTKKLQPRLKYADLATRFISTPDSPDLVRQAIIEIRSAKFPDWHKVGTAGSFFKNPIIKKSEADALSLNFPDLPIYQVSDEYSKVSLGFILDKICHLKGYQVGNVGLYEEQALVLVTNKEASATEILQFSNDVATRVYDVTKIFIEREVTFLE